jgi:glucose-6-phosphate isomerase
MPLHIDQRVRNRNIALFEILLGSFHVEIADFHAQVTASGVNDKIDTSDLLILKSVLDTADLAKFAKHETSFYERESHIKKVFVFLSNTKDESLENPKPTIETIVLNDGIQRRYRIFLALGLLLSILGSVTVLYYVLSQLVQVYSY